MVERRGGIGLLSEELLEVSLLSGGALEDERDSADGGFGSEWAKIVREADAWIQ